MTSFTQRWRLQELSLNKAIVMKQQRLIVWYSHSFNFLILFLTLVKSTSGQ